MSAAALPSEPERRSLISDVGLILGPAAALGLWWSLSSNAAWPDEARAAAGVALLMAVWWSTEAIPLPVTSVLPVVLFPLTGVYRVEDGLPSPISRAAAPYAHEFIFLYMGGFMIALAMEKWNLHRRIALRTVLAVGTSPARLVAGFMLASAALSMWISNTATTVMMLPIGLSVVGLLTDSTDDGRTETGKNFSVVLMLGIAYAASIGGTATLVGSPPNAVLAGYLKNTWQIDVTFGNWFALCAPFAALYLVATWLLLTRVLFPLRVKEIRGGEALIRDELRKLGPLSRPERSILAVFAVTATLWIVHDPLEQWDAFIELVPWWTSLHDAGIALGGAAVLFLLPVDRRRGIFTLDWKTAERLPWGMLLLLGGGLSLARAVNDTGLATRIGEALPSDLALLALVVVVTGIVIFLTELTSNIATTSAFLPVLGGLATASHTDPRWLTIPATIAASCAFMLPVATPPNAIVFGSGHIRISQMVRAGFWLNLIGLIAIPALMYTLGAWIFGL